MPPPPDYLVLGHLTCDRVSAHTSIPGGTALYAATTAHRLGLRGAILTAAASVPSLPFAVTCLASAETSTFENRYVDGVRHQFVHAIAAPLDLAALPPDWSRSPIVHLGPVLHECDLAMITAFPQALIGVTPQGWLRRWHRQLPAPVLRADWRPPAPLLARVDLLVVSSEDLAGDEAQAAAYARVCRLVVLTRGANGLTLFVDGVPQDIPAVPATEVDPTGAGDVFAAAMLVRLRETGDAYEAARFAAAVAAAAVEGPGTSRIPDRAAALARYARSR